MSKDKSNFAKFWAKLIFCILLKSSVYNICIFTFALWKFDKIMCNYLLLSLQIPLSNHSPRYLQNILQRWHTKFLHEFSALNKILLEPSFMKCERKFRVWAVILIHCQLYFGYLCFPSCKSSVFLCSEMSLVIWFIYSFVERKRSDGGDGGTKRDG